MDSYVLYDKKNFTSRIGTKADRLPLIKPKYTNGPIIFPIT